ncbi:MAG TPA: tRNA pseudouridine(38-40) synthase TruA [Burkholderiales bacterium]|nr:tRNA pseudouridine(38-40) synthase TruA [Burkholderiales bacterium]
MRIALGIAYDGRPFDGWQSQPTGDAVQDRLEAALAEIAGVPVRVTAAGRTDAGVHAIGQVAHFDVATERPESAWMRGTNAHLPEGIAVQWAREVDDEFHARFSAVSRSYTYVLYNHPVRPAVFAGKVGWFHLPLDVAVMRTAAACLAGEHDFSAFRSSECQAKTPVKMLHRMEIRRRGDYVIFELTADAFLHHMVRNLVGCLVHVGKGAQPPDWLKGVLEGRDRARAAPTFPADGLYLTAVAYHERWNLPAFAPMLALLEAKG